MGEHKGGDGAGLRAHPARLISGPPGTQMGDGHECYWEAGSFTAHIRPMTEEQKRPHVSVKLSEGRRMAGVVHTPQAGTENQARQALLTLCFHSAPWGLCKLLLW